MGSQPQEHLAYWETYQKNTANHESTLPYWQVNIPPSQRTTECPTFLRSISPKDLSIISTPDSAYVSLSWPSVKQLVQSGQIRVFDRKPSNLRRYLEYLWNLKRDYGSVIDFVLKERLHWEEGMVVEGEKWGSENLKVLWNDWPYGIDESVVHLVVWTKFWLDEIPGEDQLVPEVEEEIKDYVRKTFVEDGGMEAEDVIWFKNWKSLKSVHAVEHFHVMLKNPDPAFIDRLTGGDEPLSRRLKRAEAKKEDL